MLPTIVGIRTAIARAVAAVAYACAPKGSQVETDLRPIWRPGQE